MPPENRATSATIVTLQPRAGMLSFWAAAENRSTLSVWGQKQVHAKINSKTDPTSPAIGLKRNVPIFPVKTQVHPSCLLCLTFHVFFCRFLANQRSFIVPPYAPHRNADVRGDPLHIPHHATPATHVSACFAAAARSSCIVG